MNSKSLLVGLGVLTVGFPFSIQVQSLVSISRTLSKSVASKVSLSLRWSASSSSFASINISYTNKQQLLPSISHNKPEAISILRWSNSSSMVLNLPSRSRMKSRKLLRKFVKHKKPQVLRSQSSWCSQQIFGRVRKRWRSYCLDKAARKRLSNLADRKIAIFQLCYPWIFDRRYLPEHSKPDYQEYCLINSETFLQQVAVFRKLAQYSEEELAQNPQLLSDLGSQEKEQEEILIEEGLGTEFEPALAIYDLAATKFKSDPTVRMKIAKIDQGYQRSTYLSRQSSWNTLEKSKTRPFLKEISTRWRKKSSFSILLFDPIFICSIKFPYRLNQFAL